MKVTKARPGVPSNMLVTHLDPSGAASEAFRVLRTNLQFLGLDKPLKSVVLTSAIPGEGKTTTISNLAVAFAQAGAKVCLVDGDLRRPMVAKFFGIDNWTGLTTALIGQQGLGDCIQQTAVPGLVLLPSGPIPPNPAELLGSAKMSKLLEQLQEMFDMVLIDTPPVLAVTDAAVLAPKVGGVILLTRSGKVARQHAVRARDALQAVRATILGVILDGVTESSSQGYYYYYYYRNGESDRVNRKK